MMKGMVKSKKIGQSASKRPIQDEGSTTIPKGSRVQENSKRETIFKKIEDIV